MTFKEFFDSLNVRRDKRTVLNFLKMPLILGLRIPIGLFLLLVIWIEERSDIIMDYLPGWDSR